MAQNGWLCDSMLTMLFTLDMPSLWDLSRASGDTVAPYVFVPPCFYPPHLRKHHHMSSVRSVKLFRNRWPASAPPPSRLLMHVRSHPPPACCCAVRSPAR